MSPYVVRVSKAWNVKHLNDYDLFYLNYILKLIRSTDSTVETFFEKNNFICKSR